MSDSIDTDTIENNNVIKFYQGLDELSKGKNNEDSLKLIKQKIFDLSNMKNINFLFGSGTSAGSIPTMTGFIEKKMGTGYINE